MQSNTQKVIKLLIILACTAAAIIAVYFWAINDQENKIEEITGGAEITSSELALALLNQSDVEKSTGLTGSIRGAIPQFSDTFAKDDTELYKYENLVTVSFLETSERGVVADNALTLFKTPEEAQNFVTAKAKESNAEETKSSDSKTSFLIVSEGDKDNPPSATVRFSVGKISSRITVFGGNKAIDYTSPQLLTPLVQALANTSKEKLEKTMKGENPSAINLWETNMAMNNLPDQLNGAENIGTGFINAQEWLGEIGDKKRNEIPTFKSGAHRRFKISEAPDLALDIAIIEFAKKDNAQAEKSTFFTEGVHVEDTSSKELPLPDSLKEFSVGRLSDSMAEIQASKGVYFYDITIIAPFADFDKEKGKELLLKYGEEILK